jgi:2-methylcitrate dehydratase PrpD
VDAQFNIQYCVANALLRKSSRLEHFEEPCVRDPKIMDIVKRVNVAPDPILDERGETALEMQVFTKGGAVYSKSIDFPAGFPENPLTKEENMDRFGDCIRYAKKPLPRENIEKLVSFINELEEIRDIRCFIPLLLYQNP